jgi:CubicO group peptidase (beta-lactamase class C family)
VLSWLAERITGQPFAEIVSELLWSRIGAESDALLSISHVGAPVSHGGISATVRDVARLGMLFTPSWEVVANEPVVGEALLRKIQRGGRRQIVERATDEPLGRGFGDERPRHSCYQWNWVMEDGDFYKGGFGGQGLYVSPARDLVIAYTGTTTAEGDSNKLRWVARQVASSGVLAGC